MIKTKNLLASLSLEIPALEENQEGQLRGGFGAFGIVPTGNANSNNNCNCNCSCYGNGNCNCNCSCTTNSNCNSCTTTPTTTPEAKSSSSSDVTTLFGSSFLL